MSNKYNIEYSHEVRKDVDSLSGNVRISWKTNGEVDKYESLPRTMIRLDLNFRYLLLKKKGRGLYHF